MFDLFSQALGPQLATASAMLIGLLTTAIMAGLKRVVLQDASRAKLRAICLLVVAIGTAGLGFADGTLQAAQIHNVIGLLIEGLAAFGISTGVFHLAKPASSPTVYATSSTGSSNSFVGEVQFKGILPRE